MSSCLINLRKKWVIMNFIIYIENKNIFLFFKIVLVDLVSDGGVIGDGDRFLLGGEF